jgi:hypothetical protein
MKLFASIRVLGLLLVMSGCAQLPTRAGTEYDIGFVNKTGRELMPVDVYYGNVELMGPRGLVKGATTTEGGVTLPVPPEVEVRWVDSGQSHSVKLKIEDKVRKRLTDEWTLYFVFNQDGTVQAKALKDNDEAGYAELIKGVRPEGEYRFGFVNKTGHDIESVSVNQGTTQISRPNNGSGDIPMRVKVDYTGPLLPPIPSEAELRWNEENGTPHAVKVKLDGVTNGFDGIIYLVIKPDNTVEAHPIKNGDDKGAAKVVK